MNEAVLVDVVRTPGGRRDGQLRDWHPVSLAAFVLKGLLERNDLDAALIDDVIMGCVMQVGDQSLNIARNAVLSAGWPETVPGTTVDRQCGSSQQAVHFAAQGVMAGVYDIVVASGVESMTRVPMFSSVGTNGRPWPDEQLARYALSDFPNQGLGAEMLADQYNLSRRELDEYSALSQQRASTATALGNFENEVLPIPVEVDGKIELRSQDEGIRRDTSIESLASLRPAFKEDGKITAGNSSQICDGASAALVMSRECATRLKVTPRARFHSFAIAGTDPVSVLKGPIPVTEKLFKKSGLTMDDIDIVEINEAFASVVLAWQKGTETPLSKINPNGGAIALGHPLGSSGTRLLATLVNELERTGGRYGLQVMCEGGGMANGTIIERLDR